MKFLLLVVESQKQEWQEQANDLYITKINQLKTEFDIQKIKSPKLDRDEKILKIQKEGELISKALKADDFVIVLDEKGKELESIAFSREIQRAIDSNKKRIVWVIGGAFGLSEDVKRRANATLSLSKLTLNHLVAQTLLLEQIYRGLTILKGIPYHNA